MNSEEWSVTSLASRLRSGERTVGLIAKMIAPAPVELAGYLGFDFVIIDTEHGTGGSDLNHHIRAADSAGVPALVRVSELDRAEIAWSLDGGAAGIAIPQVSTADTAREAVRLSHYPPQGVRGLATSTRAGHQGTVLGTTHLEAAASNTVVVVQIESAIGAANALDIMSVDDVTAVWIGLNDLTLEMGHFGHPDHPDVERAVNQIIEASQRSRKPLLAIADSEEEGRYWSGRGVHSLLINFTTIAARSLGALLKAHQSTQSKRTSL